METAKTDRPIKKDKAMEGNQMKMREALRALRDASRDFYNQILNSKYSEILDKYTCVKQGFPAVLDLRSAFPMANRALSAPPRNCDVGTPEEQDNRMNVYCQTHKCKSCPLWDNANNGVRCEFTWAQMPYEHKTEGAG